MRKDLRQAVLLVMVVAVVAIDRGPKPAASSPRVVQAAGRLVSGLAVRFRTPASAVLLTPTRHPPAASRRVSPPPAALAEPAVRPSPVHEYRLPPPVL